MLWSFRNSYYFFNSITSIKILPILLASSDGAGEVKLNKMSNKMDDIIVRIGIMKLIFFKDNI